MMGGGGGGGGGGDCSWGKLIRILQAYNLENELI